METEGKDKDTEGEGKKRERRHMGALAKREPWANIAPVGPTGFFQGSGQGVQKEEVWEIKETPSSFMV